MVVGVEEHLVGLQRIGSQHEGPAVTELEVGDLQLAALASEDGPVFAPVELEGFAGTKSKRDEGAAAAGLLGLVAAGRPGPGERGDAAVGAVKTERHEIGMHLPNRASLLARLARLALEPAG